ncbi:MAG: NAD(P)/FAD-dependent oxidoreductase [Candidatus Dormibacteraceae bacterium]
MSEQSGFVIVGASLAGAKAAEALREEGFGGRITLVGEEAELPYERPPLSKDYLMGSLEREKIFCHDAAWYREHEVGLRLGCRVIRVDRQAHRVETEGGESIPFDRLLFTTGASPRTLPLPGADGPGVLYLRRVGDSDRLRGTFGQGRRLVVVGAGWIGLEAAAAARAAGTEVTVLETQELPLLRVLGPEVGAIFASLHERHGVDLRFGVQVESMSSEAVGRTRVRLAGGEELDADAVLVGIGARPNTELAERAGLEVADGVVVDQALRTAADRDVFAAGDVASAYHPLFRTQVRVEHWDNAIEQGKAAARSMLRDGVAYDRVPYFYTDQYELSMEYAGHVGRDGYSRVLFRGDVCKLEFIAFWLDSEGRVLAGMNVNTWDVNETIKELVRSRQPVDATRLADPAVELGALAGTAFAE